MSQKQQIKGLWVPIVTPFNQGEFDHGSMATLVKEIDPFVDGFVPCLSSGEGERMTNRLWEDVLKVVMENTKKPVAVGILRDSVGEIAELSKIAKNNGCVAVVVAVQGSTDDAKKAFAREVSILSALPVILYNTEKVHIDSADTLKEISKNKKIVALKDSSQNQEFFGEAIRLKTEKKIDLSLLQGMENQLLESVGCDGYLISLANIEPKLCKQMFLNPSQELNKEIMERWDQFNLASEKWYVGVKDALSALHIIKSSELTKE